MVIGKFIKQYKGKDFSKVPKSKLLQDNWYFGIKYDGNYCQIHKSGDTVLMFTSGGEPFCVEEIAQDLKMFKFDFIIEAEFLNNCDGLTLNDRTNCSTGTARSNFKKGITTYMPNSSIQIFDILNRDNLDLRNYSFENRIMLSELFGSAKYVKTVIFTEVSLEMAKDMAEVLTKRGGEGGFIFHSTHAVAEKGRSNLAVKLKAKNTKLMFCVGAKDSDTIDGEYGALILKDDLGNKQAFGGLSDKLRRSNIDDLIGKTFKVKYENFIKNKYVQGFVNE